MSSSQHVSKNEKQLNDEYVGEWENGRFHGQGTLIFSDGRKYDEKFKLPKKGKYVGEFKDGKMDGKGTLTFSDDGKYLEWNGKGNSYFRTSENGEKLENFRDSGKYEGDWKNGSFHGQGTFTFPDGSIYVGQFHHGVEHGQGTLDYASGNKFEGGFEYGEKWNGKFYKTNGNIDELQNGVVVNQYFVDNIWKKLCWAIRERIRKR